MKIITRDLNRYLIRKKPDHFLSAQMALVSTFFQIFIVLGMYNFAPKVKNDGPSPLIGLDMILQCLVIDF